MNGLFTAKKRVRLSSDSAAQGLRIAVRLIDGHRPIDSPKKRMPGVHVVFRIADLLAQVLDQRGPHL